MTRYYTSRTHSSRSKHTRSLSPKLSSTHSSSRGSSSANSHSSSISKQARKVLSYAMSEDKKKRMAGAVSCMINWGEFNGYYDEPLNPPTEPFLVNYVSDHFAEHYSEETARKHMRLLRDHFELQGLKWPGGTLLKEAIKGCKRLRPPHSVRPERPPVSKERLDVMEEHLDLGDDEDDRGDRKDVAIMACIAVAFYGQARLGELLPTNSDPSLYNHLVRPTGQDLELVRKGESYLLFLPSTKTRVYRGDTIVIPRQSEDLTDPVSALYRHIVTNKLAEGTPLFSYINNAGERVVLTKKTVMERCNEIWTAAGMEPLTGHSFRIGGTSFYLNTGCDPHVVKASGRWKSDAFQRYWRGKGFIATGHLADAKNKAGLAWRLDASIMKRWIEESKRLEKEHQERKKAEARRIEKERMERRSSSSYWRSGESSGVVSRPQTRWRS